MTGETGVTGETGIPTLLVFPIFPVFLVLLVFPLGRPAPAVGRQKNAESGGNFVPNKKASPQFAKNW